MLYFAYGSINIAPRPNSILSMSLRALNLFLKVTPKDITLQAPLILNDKKVALFGVSYGISQKTN